jgi:RND superfamily putative drug exporter
VSALLFRLGRSSARHPFRVLGLWIVAAIAIVVVQGAAGGEYDDSFRVPGVESQRASDVLSEHFPSQGGQTARIVLHTDDGRLDDADHSVAIEQARASLTGANDVAMVTDPVLNADGQTAYVDVNYTVEKLNGEHLDGAVAARDIAEAGGVQTELTGALALLDQEEAGSEVIGLLAAVVVLLVAFGSVVAMGLPIVTAIVGLLIGSAAVGILSAVIDVPEFSLILCMMVGLGVGIDYALFIVTRHRQNLADGMSVEDSAGTANATAGQAVLFAGSTVVVAILGLFIAGIPALTATGAAVSTVVVVAMAAAITLLPALLGLAGTKIDRLSIHRKSYVPKPAHETLSGRWAHRVGARPVRYAIGSFVGLCLLAAPVLGMRIGTPDDGNAASGTTQRTAYDLLADGFGPGFNGPIVAVVQGDADDAAAVHAAIAADPGIATITPPFFNEAGDTAVLRANPTTAPQDSRTDDTVRRLRSEALPATGADALLTGQAMLTDMSERITSRLPLFVFAIAAMSFVLLMIVFRSILVPLKAALMNLLSIASAYGVIVAIFQWGWGNELVGLENTMPINPFAPLMMFAILFGLSMDYEVFLLSRVREEYVASGDNHLSVVKGLSNTARVITSAALIMISVFGAFVLGDDPMAKMFGIGMGVAVLLDATLVRMVLVPATMSLVGRANWWLPSWLDRVLPHLDLEGSSSADDEDVVDVVNRDRELVPVIA